LALRRTPTIHVSSLVVRNPSTQEVLIARGLTETMCLSKRRCKVVACLTTETMCLSKRRCKVVACLTTLLECPAILLECPATLLGCLVTLLECLSTLQECLKILSMTCLTILLTFLMIRRCNSLVSSLAVLTPSFLHAGIVLRTTTMVG